MGANSRIEWCDHTQNFWIGCTKVSTEVTGGGACDFCYAEQDFDLRKHIAKWGNGQPRHRTKTWGEPLKWNRQAEAFRAEHGHWPRVFANSLSDIGDLDVPREWHDESHDVISVTKKLRWMLTTKRMVNFPKLFPKNWFRDNQHVGVIISICNQPEADRDIPRALQIVAELGIAWLGLSCEPLLGPIDLTKFAAHPLVPRAIPLDWVIVGGESGPHARVTLKSWRRSLRDQCMSADVPFLHKQNGEWIDADEWWQTGMTYNPSEPPLGFEQAADLAKTGRRVAGYPYEHQSDGSTMIRVGKHAAGRLLDGRTHDEFPVSLT